MKPLFYCLLAIFSFLYGVTEASELTKVSRINNNDVIQFYFSFDVTPQFSSFRSDRRIDLEFFETTSVPSLSLGKADNDIVKILPRPTDDKYILSLFFRYRPQQYTVTKSLDGKLVLEVILGNEYSKSYQNLADKLKGLTVLERSFSDSTNPYLTSAYAKDWMSFFSTYESAVKIEIPVKFTSPPFPLISLLPPEGKANLSVLNEEMLALAKQNLWGQLAAKLMVALQTTKEIQTKKLLALTYGEALGRSGNFDAAYRQLYLLKEEYKDELLGTYAGYWLIHLRSVYEDPYIADSAYRRLESSINNALPLAPYFLLSEIETALATADYKRLNHLLLKDDVAYPQEISEIVKVRQADYWYAINQPIKAQASYQLVADSPVLPTLPSSLCDFCNIQYDLKKFEAAATCYKTLTEMVSDTPVQGLIDYRKNMSELKFVEGSTLVDNFLRIENEYPKTEAGFRAAIKKNDLLFLQNTTWGPQALSHYGAIAQEAHSRPVREEALFKQALVHAILGDAGKSIQLLQQILREFLTGDVRISAQALLIDLLPGEIKRMVDNGEYLQPLVLAKQNKDLFQNNWIDGKFLIDIAKAYNRIGIYDEAQKIYLYLIGIVPLDQKEAYFPPMIQAAYDHGGFSLVEDYAAQYTYTYPNGRYSEEIFLLRLQALMADERFNDALKLLPDPLPENKTVYELATALYFRTDHYKECLAAAKKLALIKTPLSAKEQFMYAESYNKTGSYIEAEQEFMIIPPESSYYDMCLYRLAELARRKGDEKKALSFFQKLVEIEKNSIWKQYAERELQIAKVSARM